MSLASYHCSTPGQFANDDPRSFLPVIWVVLPLLPLPRVVAAALRESNRRRAGAVCARLTDPGVEQW